MVAKIVMKPSVITDRCNHKFDWDGVEVFCKLYTLSVLIILLFATQLLPLLYIHTCPLYLLI